MKRFRQSIRMKIRLGYYAVVAVIVGLSAFTFIELDYLDDKITLGDAISEFFDTTLEIRRFEKNYFLYEQRSDYEENIRYVTRAAELFDGNIEAFAALADERRIIRLRDDLRRYKNLMERYELLIRRRQFLQGAEEGTLKFRLEAQIRQAGKDIIIVSEDLSRRERRDLQRVLAGSRRVLTISILALVVLVTGIGRVLSRMIVKPLKLMERNMEMIAAGRFENVPIESQDREVLSLARAFNKMLRELELRQRHLIQSEKLASLGTLLSGVAHELNNPLSNISSSAQILAEELGDGGRPAGRGEGPSVPDVVFAREMVEQINDQTDRARNIVRSLLEFSREREFRKQDIPLKGLIEETIRFVKGQMPVKVVVTLDIPVDLAITADKQRIQQAFLNLIKNAVEALPEEGTVSVRARQHRAVDKLDDGTGIFSYLAYRGKCTLEHDTVDIEIRDTGPGIPADLLPKVFDPFFTTKDVGKGSGLGLFIVHEIIEEHDGCIAVDSGPGEGTTFLIRLPAK